MRMYDARSGRRFDMNHPMWQTHMINKDGSVKQRMDFKKALELEALGVIRLVPSTTEVAKIADSAGAFGAGAKWGMEIGVSATIDTSSRIAEGDVAWRDAAQKLAQERMNEPRDAGSAMHDAFHRWRQGQKKEDMSAQEQGMIEACCCVLDFLNIPVCEVETEVEFALDSHGGTIDLKWMKEGVVVDWKTVKDFRPFKPSEAIQLGGYSLSNEELQKGYIVQVHQTTFKSTVKEVRVDVAACGFFDCLNVWHRIKELEKMLK